MSAQIPAAWISQLGSKDLAELSFSTLSVGPPATGTSYGGFSIVAPPSVPTGIEMGNWALRYNPSASAAVIAGYAGIGQAATIGYWWRPQTNPSLNTVNLIGLDDGSINGAIPGWRASDKKIVIRNLLDTVLATATTVAPDTAEVYHGVTNPWYYVQYVRYRDYKAVRFWKWNNDTTSLDLIETITTSGFSEGQAIYVNYGNRTGTGVTGAWTATNFYVCGGWSAGLWGPLGVSMATGFPITLETSSASWVKGDAGTSDATTGAGNTEYPYINENPPVDTSASYLKNTSSGSSTPTQYYKCTASLVPAGKNVLAALAGCRFWTNDTDVLLSVNMRLGTGAAKNSSAVTIVRATSVWLYDFWVCASKLGSPLADFATGSTDTDNIQIGHTRTLQNASMETRVSQMFLTVAYGADEAALSAVVTGQTQVA